MKRSTCLITLLAITLSAGCHSDIVTTSHLKELDRKCVYIEPIGSIDPQVGQVLKNVIEKEFLRKNVALCDPNSATVLLSGATFMTTRGKSSGNLFGNSAVTAQCCESVSITARDREGNVLLSASYDNADRKTVSDFGKDFGSALAGRFR